MRASAAAWAAHRLQPVISSVKRSRVLGWVFALLLVGALVAVFRGLSDERRTAELVGRAEPRWILAIVALQALTYVVLAIAWTVAIRAAGSPAPRGRALVRIALAELFADQAVPSAGAVGSLVVVRALRRRNVSKEAASAAVVASFLGFYVAQLAGVLAGAAALAARRAATGLAAGVVALDLVVAVAAPLVVIAAVTGAVRLLPRRVARLSIVSTVRSAVAEAPRRSVLSVRVLGPVTAARAAILLLDGATLAAALAAVGHPPSVDVAIAAFVLAQVAASVTFLPGGLGSFEAVAAGLLASAGVPVEAAVPAILVMRAFSFWLPMLPGLAFARGEMTAEPAGQSTDRRTVG